MSPIGMDSLYEPELYDDNCMFHHEDEFTDFYPLRTSLVQSKKVYVVLECGYETLCSAEIIGVFTSEELAKKCCEKNKYRYIKCIGLDKE